MRTTYFEAWLNESLGLDEMAARLRRAVWPAGHEASAAWDPAEGRPFLVVMMHGPQPAQELVRLMENAGLQGCFEPFPKPFRLLLPGRAL
jgi:hypothetical protein